MLAETIREIDRIVATAQATGRVPALVAAIVRDGSLAHFTGAGELPPPDPDTQYRIGSISKTFTAALILRLRDEEKLDLDDLLYRHLPGTPVGGVTIRQLLGHVSGLRREPAGEWWERSAGLPVDEFLAELAPDQAIYPPLRTYHYSNRASGQGLGLQMWRRGERVHVGHTGSMPGYLAVLAVHRPSRTGVVAFANAYTLAGGSLGALGLRLLTTVLDAEPPRIAPWRPSQPPPPEAGPLAGRWWWVGRGVRV